MLFFGEIKEDERFVYNIKILPNFYLCLQIMIVRQLPRQIPEDLSPMFFRNGLAVTSFLGVKSMCLAQSHPAGFEPKEGPEFTVSWFLAQLIKSDNVFRISKKGNPHY